MYKQLAVVVPCFAVMLPYAGGLALRFGVCLLRLRAPVCLLLAFTPLLLFGTPQTVAVVLEAETMQK